ncbi:Dmc1b [Giardia muris]|uniref:Dmc1b n=1 Tax=Giardia muris TaxID=5742 RepID=A0A4Z1TA46_GIAMU|nr:Dmc1b [Giardia muris]|eukprot:TNJ30097.1 Dmc1b [Giardia muris]
MPPRHVAEDSATDLTAETEGTGDLTEESDDQVDTTVADVSQEKHVVTSVDALKAQGIPAGDIQKLQEGKIYTIEELRMTTRKQLNNIRGLSETKVDKILAAADKIGQSYIQDGLQALEDRKNILKITTGSTELDALLQGGIESKCITEVFGEFRCGKTQLCHTLAVTAQLPRSKKGGGGRVLFIDTEKTFLPEKIKQIAQRFGLDPGKVLESITVARIFNYEQQMSCLAAVSDKLAEHKYSLVIIDSITALFRTDFKGRGELAERQQNLGQHLATLSKVAHAHNLAVFITNQVMAQVDGAAMFTADPKKPIGGHILAHASTTRLYFRKGRGETRVAKVFSSPYLPEAEATFAIAAEGIIDATE